MHEAMPAVEGAAPGAGPVRLGLSPAERRAWREDGFFLRPAALRPDEVAALGAAAEALVQTAQRGTAEGECYRIDGNAYVEAVLGAGRPQGPRESTVQLEHRPGSRTIRVIEPFHHLDERFEALVDDPRIVDVMAELVGSERVALFTDKLNLKRPREGSGFRWHQDSPYWRHFCDHLDRLPNVMVALDDARRGNGCLRLIPGSHVRGPLPGCEGDGVLGPLFTHPDHVDEGRAFEAEMTAGSLLFFSPHSVHGSEPNRSDLPRRALVLTYQPAGLRMFKVDAVREAGAPLPGQGQR